MRRSSGDGSPDETGSNWFASKRVSGVERSYAIYEMTLVWWIERAKRIAPVESPDRPLPRLRVVSAKTYAAVCTSRCVVYTVVDIHGARHRGIELKRSPELHPLATVNQPPW